MQAAVPISQVKDHTWLHTRLQDEETPELLPESSKNLVDETNAVPLGVKPRDEELDEVAAGEDFLREMNMANTPSPTPEEGVYIRLTNGVPNLIFDQTIHHTYVKFALLTLERVGAYLKAQGISLPTIEPMRMTASGVLSDPIDAINKEMDSSPPGPINRPQINPIQEPITPEIVEQIRKGVNLKDKFGSGNLHPINLETLCMTESELLDLHKRTKPKNIVELVKLCLSTKGQFRSIARRFDVNEILF